MVKIIQIVCGFLHDGQNNIKIYGNRGIASEIGCVQTMLWSICWVEGSELTMNAQVGPQPFVSI
jgi:hypothetical protein